MRLIIVRYGWLKHTAFANAVIKVGTFVTAKYGCDNRVPVRCGFHSERDDFCQNTRVVFTVTRGSLRFHSDKCRSAIWPLLRSQQCKAHFWTEKLLSIGSKIVMSGVVSLHWSLVKVSDEELGVLGGSMRRRFDGFSQRSCPGLTCYHDTKLKADKFTQLNRWWINLIVDKLSVVFQWSVNSIYTPALTPLFSH